MCRIRHAAVKLAASPAAHLFTQMSQHMYAPMLDLISIRIFHPSAIIIEARVYSNTFLGPSFINHLITARTVSLLLIVYIYVCSFLHISERIHKNIKNTQKTNKYVKDMS